MNFQETFKQQKVFNKPELEVLNLKQVTLENGRYYESEEHEKFYSVTTFLSKTADKTHLINWRKRVGNKEADKISRDASSFGTKLHLLAEKLLDNEYDTFIQDADSYLENRFRPIKKFLETEINILLGSELKLKSSTLKLAGTCDLLYKDHNGEIILGDFKTSKKPKKIEWLENYFLQLTVYSIMINECYNIVVDKAVLIFSYDDGSSSTVYFQPTKYLGTLRTRLKQFYEIIRLEKANVENQLF